MNKIGTQKIDTERCVLRRIVPDDYEVMYENWARLEGIARQKYYKNGRFIDAAQYAVLRSDFR